MKNHMMFKIFKILCLVFLKYFIMHVKSYEESYDV
jgi:hypothetical protein